MRTKNLLNGKPEGGFLSLAAVLPSFGLALAVFAASVMAPAGCDSPAGGGNGYDEAASAGASAPVFDSAGVIKHITVKFDVKNGGYGLVKSQGIVSTQDDSHLRWGFGELANDFEIRITVPGSENYLNIRWKAWDFFWRETYLKAGLQIGDGDRSYTVVLDYNGRGKVAAKNLRDVSVNTKDVNNDWKNACDRAEKLTEPDAARTVRVKFKVKNGGNGLSKSEGMVYAKDDSYVVYNSGAFANDYKIGITVPESDEYVNVIWKGHDIFEGVYYARGKMKAESGRLNIVDIDYSYFNVAVKNLYDSATYAPFDGPDEWKAYWEDHKNRSVHE